MRRRATCALVASLVTAAVPAAPDPASSEPVPITGPAAIGASLRERPPSVPDDATLVAAGAVIGSIAVRTLDIFDLSKPEENRWPFRAANALHPKTRANAVRHLLPIRTGDRYDPGALIEAEQVLRKSNYLYDAWIRPVRYVENRVDLEVTTRDVWTLTLGIGFGRSGGENRVRCTPALRKALRQPSR